MTTGVITNIVERRLGGTLVTDAVDTVTTILEVDDAGDFSETFLEARYLVIGNESTPREYVAVENDPDAQNTVTLAAAVDADFEAGLPVTLWDPASQAVDQRAIEYRAWVLLDEQNKTVPAGIPHEMIPFTGGHALKGVHVRLEEASPGEWEVSEALGREAVVDQAAVRAPAFSMRLSTDVTVSTGTDTVLTSWEGDDGTDDANGSAGGAPVDGKGWFRAGPRDFRWTGV